jgi:hypothetical protein
MKAERMKAERMKAERMKAERMKAERKRNAKMKKAESKRNGKMKKEEDERGDHHLGVITGKSLINCYVCGVPYTAKNSNKRRDYEQKCEELPEIFCERCGKGRGSRF